MRLCDRDDIRDRNVDRTAGDRSRHRRTGRDRLQRDVGESGFLEEAHLQRVVGFTAHVERCRR
jgi:hypothetical protein